MAILLTSVQYVASVDHTLLLLTESYPPPPHQDHGVRGGGRAQRAGRDRVPRRLHHGGLPAAEGRAAPHPGGTEGRECLSQCEWLHCTAVGCGVLVHNLQ